MPPRGIPGSLRRLADLMRLRATKIEHTFGRFGSFGCFSRAIDAVTCAPHQSRQGLPLCRAGVPRWVGQERRESGDMAPYRGLFIASTRPSRACECRRASSLSRMASASDRSPSTARITAVPWRWSRITSTSRSGPSTAPSHRSSSRRCCACEPVNRGPNVARLLRSRREATRIRCTVSGLSMRAPDSRARSSSSWAHR
jgi:hypothetical protein